MSERMKENSSKMYTNGDPKWNEFVNPNRKTKVCFIALSFRSRFQLPFLG